MRKSLLGFALAAALLPVSIVHAGVKEDLAAGKSVEEIISQAKADGQDIEDVLGQIISNAPDKAYAAVAAAMAAYPDQTSKISSFAVSKGLDRSTIATMASNARSGGLFSSTSSVGTGFGTGNNLGSPTSSGGGGGSGATHN